MNKIELSEFKETVSRYHFSGNKYETNHFYSFKNKVLTWIEEQERIISETKPVIPQFVAGYIENIAHKSIDDPIFRAIIELEEYRENGEWDSGDKVKFFEWIEDHQDNIGIYYKACINGYEVEQEQLYYVMDKHDKLLLRRFFYVTGIDPLKIHSSDLSYGHVKKIRELNEYQLTEKQIKDYDENYMAFAKKIEEVEQ